MISQQVLISHLNLKKPWQLKIACHRESEFKDNEIIIKLVVQVNVHIFCLIEMKTPQFRVNTKTLLVESLFNIWKINWPASKEEQDI